MNNHAKKVPDIGFFIPAIDHDYQREVLTKLLFCMESRECNLHVFCGQTIPPSDATRTQSDLVFPLPSPDVLDGLISATGSMLNYSPLENILPLISQYRDIPIVSLSYPLEYATNVLINNVIGINELTRHLIEFHGFKDIVHIAGPKWSLEAQDRAKAFLYTLQRYGLIKDNKRIIRASFTRESGYAAAQALITDYEKLPEAVVCTNDEVAFAFCKAMEAHGVHVPDDIAVTGFDNMISSKLSTPSISTASQPLNEMIGKALDILIDQTKGILPDPVYEFDTVLELRESCACRSINKGIIDIQSTLDAIQALPFEKGDTQEETFAKNETRILSILKSSLGSPSSLPKGVDRHLSNVYKALVSDFCQSGAPVVLNVTVERFYIWAHHPYTDTIEWKAFHSSIVNILKALFPEPDKKQFLDHFCLQLLFELDAIAQKVYHRDLFDQHDLFTLSNRIIEQLNAVTSYEALHLALRSNCQLLEFKECYCCLLEVPVLMNEYYNTRSVRKISMVVGKHNNTLLEEVSFTTETLLPRNLLAEGYGQNLAYFSLCTGNLYYGYFACDLENMISPLASTIRQQLSNILDRLDLLDKLEEDTLKIMRISLHDALTGLLNRRGFFEEGQRILMNALEKKQEIALLFGDMDGLKAINDTYGHQSGDIALKSIAHCLKDTLREGDIVSRFGGDEFALLLRGSENTTEIDHVLQRIQNRIDHFNQHSTLPYDIHISFGYALKQKNERKDLETLIEEADQLLYSQKARKHSPKTQP